MYFFEMTVNPKGSESVVCLSHEVQKSRSRNRKLKHVLKFRFQIFIFPNMDMI